MPLATGTRMGPYEILAAIGAGGMGEVYRARDTRLRRDVAIKVLGSRLQAKGDGHERLLQEARAASALNHPNILSLYDICSENGSEFLVMELVRGKTLDQLIGKHGLAVNEAVKYAIPIADALARAHAAGILHRDLKPSNIMITEDGAPKILDFGLAQAAEPEHREDGDGTRTLTEAAEQVVAGTAGYMSPEQAEGKKLDARSDIFSFGAVLYEMVTGRRAFRGETSVSTISSVLHDDPKPPSQISDDIPRDLEKIIARCLRKDRERRFQNMADVRVALLELKEESESGKLPMAETPRRRNKTAWLVAGLSAALLIAAGGSIEPLPFVGRDAVSPAIASRQSRLAYTRSSVDIDIWRADGHTAGRDPASSTEVEYNPQFSPDGKRIAFESDRSGPEEIWIANSDGSNPVQLTNFGRHCGSPRWSPDGKWIAFDSYMVSGRWEVWIVGSNGGKPRQLTSSPGRSIAPSFSHDAKWVYFADDRTGRDEIFRVPFTGGAAVQITHSGGRWPQESVDGQTVYYEAGPKAMLHEVPAAGGQEHSLGVHIDDAAFQVMSDGIYFIAPEGKDNRGREIRFYDFATHQSRLIQALGDVNTFMSLAVSPDRKSFLYSVGQDNGTNLMLVENFR